MLSVRGSMNSRSCCVVARSMKLRSKRAGLPMNDSLISPCFGHPLACRALV